jgi:hypothetical protein
MARLFGATEASSCNGWRGAAPKRLRGLGRASIGRMIGFRTPDPPLSPPKVQILWVVRKGDREARAIVRRIRTVGSWW